MKKQVRDIENQRKKKEIFENVNKEMKSLKNLEKEQELAKEVYQEDIVKTFGGKITQRSRYEEKNR